jgi:hypothetical protein
MLPLFDQRRVTFFECGRSNQLNPMPVKNYAPRDGISQQLIRLRTKRHLSYPKRDHKSIVNDTFKEKFMILVSLLICRSRHSNLHGYCLLCEFRVLPDLARDLWRVHPLARIPLAELQQRIGQTKLGVQCVSADTYTSINHRTNRQSPNQPPVRLMDGQSRASITTPV